MLRRYSCGHKALEALQADLQVFDKHQSYDDSSQCAFGYRRLKQCKYN